MHCISCDMNTSFRSEKITKRFEFRRIVKDFGLLVDSHKEPFLPRYTEHRYVKMKPEEYSVIYSKQCHSEDPLLMAAYYKTAMHLHVRRAIFRESCLLYLLNILFALLIISKGRTSLV